MTLSVGLSFRLSLGGQCWWQCDWPRRLCSLSGFSKGWWNAPVVGRHSGVSSSILYRNRHLAKPCLLTVFFRHSFGTKFSRGFLVVSRGVAGFPKDPSPHQDVARRRMDTLARLSDRVTGLAELRTQFSEWWQVSICLSETRRVS